MDTNNIVIEAAYQSEERAIMDGYEYGFYSSRLGKYIYKKRTGDGTYTYAVIEGFC